MSGIGRVYPGFWIDSTHFHVMTVLFRIKGWVLGLDAIENFTFWKLCCDPKRVKKV
jgi:hypothetical protein